MSAIAFDTHAYVKRLTSVGITEAQAEVFAEEQAKLIENQLATKSDLAPLATKADLAEFKTDILKWMIGMIGFQTVVILAAVVALGHFGH